MKNIKISNELRGVFEKLIPIYEKAVEELPEDEWYKYIWSNHLDNGICGCAIDSLGFSIYEEMELIGIWFGFNDNWFDIPCRAKTHTEAKDLLQKRIDIMKELLKTEK